MKIRSSGILLHLSSLPSRFGIGDMGPEAFRFVDFLSSAKQRFWQMLPLNPTASKQFYSPYHSTSAFAFNSLFISPELLVEEGLLVKRDLKTIPRFSRECVDYLRVARYKEGLLNKAYRRFKKNGASPGFETFCSHHAYWLDDFSLFTALGSVYPGKSWNKWLKKIRDRSPGAIKAEKEKMSDDINRNKFLQYLFYRQWISLKAYCNEKGVLVIGDLPIYVQYNSVDVWTHPQYFKLDDKKQPAAVAGVPPDYFSDTGQLWGNPIYRWDRLKADGYDWWMKRIAHNLHVFDFLRIDHFRGLVSYWEVPAKENNAVNGKWEKGPAEDFFRTLLIRFPHSPFIAEDLGFITSDVREILHRFSLPGMRVLLFGFGDNQPASPHAPHNIIRNCVVYTGTHDNNTARGWFEEEATPETKKRLFRYLGRKITKDKVSRELIRLAMTSVANTAILPMQDILGLGADARMNQPATKEGNWQWRLLPGQVTTEVKDSLLRLTEISGRG